MRILIADDHPLYREAVRAQLERLLPEADITDVASLDEAMARANDGAVYSLFLLDFRMPGMSLGALQDFAAKFPAVPIAVISGSAEPAEIQASIQAGARGFIPKTATAAHLAHAIQLVLAGGTSVPADMLIPLAADSGAPAVPWLGQLTPRECEVLKGVTRGLSNKEVGRELNLAEVTIKLHLRNVFRKIGARSRADAAVIATRAGIA